MSVGGDKTKKFETFGYNFHNLGHTKCSMFFTPNVQTVHTDYLN